MCGLEQTGPQMDRDCASSDIADQCFNKVSLKLPVAGRISQAHVIWCWPSKLNCLPSPSRNKYTFTAYFTHSVHGYFQVRWGKKLEITLKRYTVQYYKPTAIAINVRFTFAQASRKSDCGQMAVYFSFYPASHQSSLPCSLHPSLSHT